MTTFPCLYEAPFGNLTLVFDRQDNLLKLWLHGLPEHAPYPVPAIWQQKLDDYFAGRLKDFGVQIMPDGTAFQQTVWQAVAEIPYGSAMTYQDIARKIGSHPRAVAGAVAKNPLSLIIPTHRVVSKHTNQHAPALAERNWLLQLESRHTES